MTQTSGKMLANWLEEAGVGAAESPQQWNCDEHARIPNEKRSVEPRPLAGPLRQGWQNNTWPTLPFGSAASMCRLCQLQEP